MARVAGMGCLGLLGLLVATASASAQVAIGTIGHSLTDEYQRPQSTRQAGLEGFNWLEILSRTRASEVSFGPYDATLDGNGEPLGFAYNHAIGGAMVLHSNLPQQVAGLSADVGAGRVDAIVIWIGSLDFSVRMWNGGTFDLAEPSFQSFQADFVGTLVGALDTLIAAGATDIALAKIGAADPTRSDIVLATSDTNDKLAAAVGARPQVSFFDPLAELVARYDAGANAVRIGGFASAGDAAPSSALVAPPGGVSPTQCGFNEQTKAPACPTAAYQAHLLQDDGAHFTTPIQGLVANAVVAALGSRGFALTPLSDSEILSVAGVGGPAPTSDLALRWLHVATKCKRSTGACALKGTLSARNGAATTSQATTLSLSLSSDATADAGDLALGSRTLPPLRSGKLKKVKWKVKLPAGVSPSGSYVIVVPAGGAAMAQGPLN